MKAEVKWLERGKESMGIGGSQKIVVGDKYDQNTLYTYMKTYNI